MRTQELETSAGRAYVWSQGGHVGGWGLANCTMVITEITGGDELESRPAVLVDTPYTLQMAQEMTSEFRLLQPDAKIRAIVNTHHNGDHAYTNGYSEFAGAEIISTRACHEHAHHDPTPDQMQRLVHGADSTGSLRNYLRRHFGRFDWAELSPRPPTRTFDGELAISVGATELQLIEVGPAHTKGDAIAHFPQHSLVCTGDICFLGDHPVHWAGPIANILTACERILALGAETIVPGHGPVAGTPELLDYMAYLRYVQDRIHTAFQQGNRDILDVATPIIAESRYPSLGLPERIVIVAGMELAHLSGSAAPSVLGLLTLAAEYADFGT